VLRSWPALLAWGAGLIHLAIGAAVARADGDGNAIMLLTPMLVVGAAEIAWGVAVLRAGRIRGGRAAAVGAIIAVLMGAVALVGGAPVIAVGTSSALAIASGAMAARMREAGVARTGKGEEPVRASRSRAAGVAVGALLVAALAMPGLAQTDAATNGDPHDHGVGADLPLVDPHAHH